MIFFNYNLLFYSDIKYKILRESKVTASEEPRHLQVERQLLIVLN